MPPGGGFDEETALVCLHQSPQSSRMFQAFLPIMGRDRSVYAPDTPGYGESDPPPAPPTIGDYAAAMGDWLQSLRLRKVDLLGVHTGAAIATELALLMPDVVRRLALVGVPLLGETERANFRRSPWPLPPTEDGTHLAREWERSVTWRGPGVSLELLAQSFVEKLRAGPRAAWGAAAVMSHALRERLAAVTQPVLVLRPRDDLWEATGRVRELRPGFRCVDLPDLGFGLFDLVPERLATLLREFLAR
jgi:pimeloyl-ACP methyl ester carboxylesterase